MSSRLNFIPARLLQAIPVVFGVTLLVFFMAHLLPGDPAIAMLGDKATEERIAALRTQLGLDQPIWVQYGIFLAHLGQANLGDSLTQVGEKDAVLNPDGLV